MSNWIPEAMYTHPKKTIVQICLKCFQQEICAGVKAWWSGRLPKEENAPGKWTNILPAANLPWRPEILLFCRFFQHKNHSVELMSSPTLKGAFLFCNILNIIIKNYLLFWPVDTHIFQTFSEKS